MLNYCLFFRGAKHLERSGDAESREETLLATKLITLHQELEDMKLAESRLDELIEDCQKEMKHYSGMKSVNKYLFKQ